MVRIEACLSQLPPARTDFAQRLSVYLDTSSFIECDLQLINTTAQAVYGGKTSNCLCKITCNFLEKYKSMSLFRDVTHCDATEKEKQKVVVLKVLQEFFGWIY